MLKNTPAAGFIVSPVLVTSAGAVAGALYTCLILFPSAGISHPRLDWLLALVLNVILKAIAGAIAGTTATIAGYIGRRLCSKLWVELLAVYVSAFAALFVASYVTISVFWTPDLLVLAVIAALVTLTYFGSTRVCARAASRHAVAV